MASGVSVLGFPGLNLVDTNAFQYGPKGDMSPEVALQEQALNRKQQIANLLIQRGLAPLPSGQMAGRFFVPTSPVQGAAQLASVLAGAFGTHMIDGSRKDLAQQDNDMVMKALEAYRNKTAPVETQAEGPGAPVPTGLKVGEGYTPEELQEPTPLYGTKQEALQRLHDSRTGAFFQEGPRPTQPVPVSADQKHQAIIELMANQHPRVAGLGKMLAQEEQHQQQMQLQHQQALTLERMKEIAALNLKQTPSADSQAEIGSREKLHGIPSGNAQLQARDQVVTVGPNGELVPNKPVIDAKKEIAAAGAARTEVAVNTNLPASEEAQKEYMKGARATYDQLKMAPQALENIEKAKALIPQAKGFMGPGGESMLEAAKFLNNRLGTSINTEGIKSAEELRSRIFFNIMENLKKMDAQPSEMQQRIMQESLGKLGTDPNALPAVLDAYADAIRGKIDAYNTDVSGAEKRGVKFPYDPVIKLPPAKPAQPSSSGLSPEEQSELETLRKKYGR